MDSANHFANVPADGSQVPVEPDHYEAPLGILGQALLQANYCVSLKVRGQSVDTGSTKVPHQVVHWLGNVVISCLELAEGVGFEPTNPLGVSGFQDRRLRPLGHPSVLIIVSKSILFAPLRRLDFLQLATFWQHCLRLAFILA